MRLYDGWEIDMKWGLALWVVVMIALHQDVWNWTNKTLVFGFLPMGLAYHIFYALLASATMWLLVTFAWPKHLDELESKDD